MAASPDIGSVRASRRARIAARVAKARADAGAVRPMVAAGRLVRMVGLTLEAAGCQVPVGGRCRIVGEGGHTVDAEAVGFGADRIYLMPVGDVRGLTPHARVVPVRHATEVQVGPHLLGRVIDGAGHALDGRSLVPAGDWMPLQGRPVNPLRRLPIRDTLDVGVRAINGLFTVGRGQRMGLFAGSGVGKSSLLGMMTRYTDADIIVVGLVGERGREVNEFVQTTLGPGGMARAVVVATPADHSPLMRMQGAMLATSVAEYFRDRGRNVLLLMDSLTRFAQAQREIGLAIGEPPTTRGYTPSVFTRLPQLVERAGNDEHSGGSITAFYTVLAEGDDTNDPVADAARAILDGHIVLSRRIAEGGRYPAIDVEASVSRVMNQVTSTAQQNAARRFRKLYSAYRRQEDLINIGAYQRGSNPEVDEAIRMYPRLQAFLTQSMDEPVSHAASAEALARLCTQPEGVGYDLHGGGEGPIAAGSSSADTDRWPPAGDAR